MTDNTLSNHQSKGSFAERVAAWKADTQSFFDEDWSRLRTLIRELEEESWSDNDTDGGFETPPGIARVTVEPTVSTGCSGKQNPGNPTGKAQRPPVRDRLSALAELIERRLRTTNGSGR